MSDRSAAAERCLVATCAHLAMMTVRDDTFAVWLAILGDVLPDCKGGAPALAPLVAAADRLANAPRGVAQGDALTLLRKEAERYFAMAAAHRYEAWKAARGDA